MFRNKFVRALFLMIALVSLSGCNRFCSKEVPMGTVAMVKTPDGIKKQVLYPGYHECWGRDKMYLAPLSILHRKYPRLRVDASDRVGLTFDLRITVQLRADIQKHPNKLSSLFMNQGQYLKTYMRKENVEILDGQKLIDIYVTPKIRSLARDIVGSVPSDKAMLLRTSLRNKIAARLMSRLGRTPIRLVSLGLTNLYITSDVVRQAFVKRKQREIAIDTAKENARVDMEKENARNQVAQRRIKNQLILAEQHKKLRYLKGQGEAAFYNALLQEVKDKNFYLAVLDRENREKLISAIAAGKADISIITGMAGGSGILPVMNIPVPKGFGSGKRDPVKTEQVPKPRNKTKRSAKK